MTTFLLMTRQL